MKISYFILQYLTEDGKTTERNYRSLETIAKMLNVPYSRVRTLQKYSEGTLRTKMKPQTEAMTKKYRLVSHAFALKQALDSLLAKSTK